MLSLTTALLLNSVNGFKHHLLLVYEAWRDKKSPLYIELPVQEKNGYP